jgi:hypothetical protein
MLLIKYKNYSKNSLNFKDLNKYKIIILAFVIMEKKVFKSKLTKIIHSLIFIVNQFKSYDYIIFNIINEFI